VLFFSGDLDASRDEVSVRVNTVLTPEEAPHALTGSVHLDLGGDPGELPGKIRAVAERHRGTCPILMTLAPESGLSVVVRAGKSFTVDPTAALLRELEEIVGAAKIRLVPAKPTAPQRRRRRSFSP
jgi:hypothetical protein